MSSNPMISKRPKTLVDCWALPPVRPSLADASPEEVADVNELAAFAATNSGCRKFDLGNPIDAAFLILTLRADKSMKPDWTLDQTKDRFVKPNIDFDRSLHELALAVDVPFSVEERSYRRFLQHFLKQASGVIIDAIKPARDELAKAKKLKDLSGASLGIYLGKVTEGGDSPRVAYDEALAEVQPAPKDSKTYVGNQILLSDWEKLSHEQILEDARKRLVVLCRIPGTSAEKIHQTLRTFLETIGWIKTVIDDSKNEWDEKLSSSAARLSDKNVHRDAALKTLRAELELIFDLAHPSKSAAIETGQVSNIVDVKGDGHCLLRAVSVSTGVDPTQVEACVNKLRSLASLRIETGPSHEVACGVHTYMGHLREHGHMLGSMGIEKLLNAMVYAIFDVDVIRLFLEFSGGEDEKSDTSISERARMRYVSIQLFRALQSAAIQFGTYMDAPTLGSTLYDYFGLSIRAIKSNAYDALTFTHTAISHARGDVHGYKGAVSKPAGFVVSILHFDNHFKAMRLVRGGNHAVEFVVFDEKKHSDDGQSSAREQQQQQLPPENANWSCSVCTFINDGARTMCEPCENPRHAAASLDSSRSESIAQDSESSSISESPLDDDFEESQRFDDDLGGVIHEEREHQNKADLNKNLRRRRIFVGHAGGDSPARAPPRNYFALRSEGIAEAKQLPARPFRDYPYVALAEPNNFSPPSFFVRIVVLGQRATCLHCNYATDNVSKQLKRHLKNKRACDPSDFYKQNTSVDAFKRDYKNAQYFMHFDDFRARADGELKKARDHLVENVPLYWTTLEDARVLGRFPAAVRETGQKACELCGAIDTHGNHKACGKVFHSGVSCGGKLVPAAIVTSRKGRSKPRLSQLTGETATIVNHGPKLERRLFLRAMHGPDAIDPRDDDDNAILLRFGVSPNPLLTTVYPSDLAALMRSEGVDLTRKPATTREEKVAMSLFPRAQTMSQFDLRQIYQNGAGARNETENTLVECFEDILTSATEELWILSDVEQCALHAFGSADDKDSPSRRAEPIQPGTIGQYAGLVKKLASCLNRSDDVFSRQFQKRVQDAMTTAAENRKKLVNDVQLVLFETLFTLYLNDGSAQISALAQKLLEPLYVCRENQRGGRSRGASSDDDDDEEEEEVQDEEDEPRHADDAERTPVVIKSAEYLAKTVR